MAIRNALESSPSLHSLNLKARAQKAEPIARPQNVIPQATTRALRDRFSGAGAAGVSAFGGNASPRESAGAGAASVARTSGLSVEQSLRNWTPPTAVSAGVVGSSSVSAGSSVAGINPIPPTPPDSSVNASKSDGGPSQRDVIAESIAQGGAPVPFVNSDGVTENVQVQPLAPTLFPLPANFQPTYEVQVGDSPSFTVTFEDEAVDHNQALAALVDGYSETSPELRGSLHTVTVSPDPKINDITGGATSATATFNTGNITFHEGDKYLNADTFHHELGHLIGADQPGGFGPFSLFGDAAPEGWGEAAAQDGNFVTPYAESGHTQNDSYNEDFAESWAAYMTAVDEGPSALDAFAARYPARFAILEGLQPPT